MNAFRAAGTVMRPLSNVKNAALIALASIMTGTTDIVAMLLVFALLSLACSSAYAFNALTDIEADRVSATKKTYSVAAAALGGTRLTAIISGLSLAAVLIALRLNWASAAAAALLWLNMMAYSHPKIRLKEKPMWDVLSGAALTYPLRFACAWYALSAEPLPLGTMLMLGTAKSAGFLLYKEQDRDTFLHRSIRNTVTALSAFQVRLTSVVLGLSSLALFFAMCMYRGPYADMIGILPQKTPLLLVLALPPLAIASMQKKGNFMRYDARMLRAAGLTYFTFAAATAWVTLTSWK